MRIYSYKLFKQLLDDRNSHCCLQRKRVNERVIVFCGKYKADKFSLRCVFVLEQLVLWDVSDRTTNITGI